MVSFWPFRAGDDAANFEKALSALSLRIDRVTSRDVLYRQRQRRLKVLWTLYTSFAYILALLILTLVVGWANWGILDGACIICSPFAIYLVRLAIHTYYAYRLDGTQAQLTELRKQRDKTIARLKSATKYHSTQELLEKYGSDPQKSLTDKPPQTQPDKTGSVRKARTGIAPPPTANIAQPVSQPAPVTSDTSSPVDQSPPQSPARHNTAPTEEFAPNAFTESQYVPEHKHGWLDRVMDLVMGEDETLPKNRTVLICSQCRLVNGQAPPGIKTLGELGPWRCMGCAAMNGISSNVEDALQLSPPQSPAVASEILSRDSEEMGEPDDSPSKATATALSQHSDAKKRPTRQKI